MQWWNDIVEWFESADGQRVIFGAIIPFVAIVVAGLVAAAIGRGATKRLVGLRERETRAAAVAALISAGHTAARWHSQPPQTREHFETLAQAADVQVRLLPLSGAGLAADWAAHELADMRTNSVSFSFQAEQTLGEYRDRLVEWLHKPGKARKLFAADLDRWRYDEPVKTDPVVLQQQQWAEEQFTAETKQTPEKAAEVPIAAPSAVSLPSRPSASASSASSAATVDVDDEGTPTQAYSRPLYSRTSGTGSFSSDAESDSDADTTSDESASASKR